MTLALALAACGHDHPSAGFDCPRENCEDCAVIADRLRDHPGNNMSVEACSVCQRLSCTDESLPAHCTNFPCIDGVRIVRGCNEDKDCAAVSTKFCGHYAARHHVCVLEDPR